MTIYFGHGMLYPDDLNTTGFELRILLNFGTHSKLEYKRLTSTQSGAAVRHAPES